MAVPTRLSAASARRIALAAQGLGLPRPTGRVDRRHLRAVLGRIGLLQIDSVNVLARAHEVPPFSRLGPYPVGLLHRMAYADAELFEYWGHAASLLPVDTHPLLRWRMAEATEGGAYGGLLRLQRERPELIERVYAEVRDRGPITAGELSEGERRSGSWWGWNDTKRALELLLWAGRLAARRRSNFEREYDLPERVLPASVLAAPTPARADAQRELVRRAARALGVATVADLADYYRLKVADARPLVADLVEEGTLVPVDVEGWAAKAFAHAGTPAGRRAVTALVSPFDPLVWSRPRAERLFGLRYRIEIYTPAHQRVHGYYVLPFLHDGAFRARVDLKGDRRRRVLLVPSAHSEPDARADTVEALAVELWALAHWLGLEDIEVAERGDLARLLAGAVAATADAASASA